MRDSLKHPGINHSKIHHLQYCPFYWGRLLLLLLSDRINDVYKTWIADAMYWPVREALKPLGGHIATAQKEQLSIGMNGILQYFN